MTGKARQPVVAGAAGGGREPRAAEACPALEVGMPMYEHARYDGAQCADRANDPDWWFADPAAAVTNAERAAARADMRRARELCQICPARAHCLEDFVYGPTTPRLGIVAGLTPVQRRAARRARAYANAMPQARRALSSITAAPPPR